jgi:hypothetical protein
LRKYNIGRSMYHKREYMVYENEQEWKATGLTVKRLDDAEKGDYVQSDNGYYLPVIHKDSLPSGKKGNKYVKFMFPKFVFHTIQLPSGDLKYKPFTFPLYPPKELMFEELDKQETWTAKEVKDLYMNLIDRQHHVQKTRISIKYREIAKLVKDGLPLNHAIVTVYPYTSRSRLRFKQIFDSILNNEHLYKLIIGDGIVKGLKEKLAERGINEDSIAENLSQCLASENASLRKWALEYTLKLFDEKEKPTQRQLDSEDISAKLSEKMKMVQ